MIKLENISKYYHNEGVVALGLRKINLEFKIGEFVAITGESGSGKSTLLNVISGIDTYEDGELYINGEETSHYNDDDWENYRQNRVAFIFQNYNLIDSYSVLKNVEVALIIQGMSRKERRRRAQAIIARVGLEKHLHHRASKLSGGEKQRLAIARALAKDTEIIVADEPTGNLDSESGRQVLKLLNDVAQDKVVLIVTHNTEQVTPYVSRRIRLFDGEVVEDVQVRPVTYLQPQVKTSRKYPSFLKNACIALDNIISQPKKAIFMLLVSLIVFAFIFFVYGSILGYSDQTEDAYSNLNNVYPERIILKRQDDGPLTADDYRTVENSRLVAEVIKEDLAISSAFRSQTSLSHNPYDYLYGTVANTKNIGKIEGRLPSAKNEVLISTPFYDDDKIYYSLIDKTQPFIFHLDYRGEVYDVEKSYTIVGVHQAVGATRLIFSDTGLAELNRSFQEKIWVYSIIFQQNLNYYKYTIENYVIDERLQGNQVYCNLVKDTIDSNSVYSLTLDGHQLEWLPAPDDVYNYDLHVSSEFYKTIFPDYQYTVNLRNGKDAEKYIDYLYEQGFYGFSPYYDTFNEFLTIISTITKAFSVAVMAFIIFISYLLSYLLFRSIMNSKVHDYLILRIIGAEKSNIRQIILLEIMASFLSAYLIFFILYQFIKSYMPFLHYFVFKDYLILGLINVFLAFIIARRYINLQAKKSLFSSLRSEI
jgi:putative ABC transport system permease protein